MVIRRRTQPEQLTSTIRSSRIVALGADPLHEADDGPRCCVGVALMSGARAGLLGAQCALGKKGPKYRSLA
jgi:hypothetical protein